MSRQLIKCQCGCGKEVYSSRVTLVTREEASDESLRVTQVVRRWIVTKDCKKQFEQELGFLELLKIHTIRWRPRTKTGWERANFLRTMDQYWLRIQAARQVMRLNHAIYERTRGFEWARQHAIKSAILFGCPRFMQGFLSTRFLLRAQRREVKEAARAMPELVHAKA